MSSNKIKVLFLIHRLGYGGAEKIITYIANSLSNKSEFDVLIYTYESSKIHYNLNENIKFIGEEKVAEKKIIRRFIQLFQVVKKIRKESPTVVISFLNMPNLFAVLAGKMTKTPVIISERGDPYQGKSLIDKAFHFVYRFATGAVFQTNGAKEFFSFFLQRKSRVIPNPIYFKEKIISPNLNTPTKEISFVARFECRQKRQDIMVEAFKKVIMKYPETILKFYGDGPDEVMIKNMVASMNMNENVRFMGVVENSLEVMAQSQMFVLTSDYEGIPNALIEAMAIGLPVVATNCSPGGAELLIEHKINGLLVPPGDSNAIAEAIIKYIENPKLAQTCGENAAKITEKYSLDLIMAEWENYIREVCDK